MWIDFAYLRNYLQQHDFVCIVTLRCSVSQQYFNRNNETSTLLRNLEPQVKLQSTTKLVNWNPSTLLMTLGCSGIFLSNMFSWGTLSIILKLQTPLQNIPNWKGFFTCELSAEQNQVPLFNKGQTAGQIAPWSCTGLRTNFQVANFGIPPGKVT